MFQDLFLGTPPPLLVTNLSFGSIFILEFASTLEVCTFSVALHNDISALHSQFPFGALLILTRGHFSIGF